MSDRSDVTGRVIAALPPEKHRVYDLIAARIAGAGRNHEGRGQQWHDARDRLWKSARDGGHHDAIREVSRAVGRAVCAKGWTLEAGLAMKAIQATAEAMAFPEHVADEQDREALTYAWKLLVAAREEQS